MNRGTYICLLLWLISMDNSGQRRQDDLRIRAGMNNGEFVLQIPCGLRLRHLQPPAKATRIVLLLAKAQLFSFEHNQRMLDAGRATFLSAKVRRSRSIISSYVANKNRDTLFSKMAPLTPGKVSIEKQYVSRTLDNCPCLLNQKDNLMHRGTVGSGVD